TTPTTLAPPAARSGLVALAASATKVTLTWQDNSSNESGFRIQRSSNGGGSGTQIAQVGAGVTTYTDTTVSKNKSYSYRVCVYNASGNSADRNAAAVMTPAKGPSLNPTPGGLTPPSPDSGGIMPITPPPAQRLHSPAGAVSVRHKGHSRQL